LDLQLLIIRFNSLTYIWEKCCEQLCKLAFESYDTLNVFPCIPQVVAILLEEGKEDEDRGQGRNQTHINVSEGYTQLDLLPLLQGELLCTSNGYIVYLARLV